MRDYVKWSCPSTSTKWIRALRAARPIFALIVLSLCALIVGSDEALARCTWPSGFIHPDQATFDDFNKSRLKSLVVLQQPNAEEKGLRANPSIGVAFLIDQRSGLLMTAAHVLAQAIKGDKSPDGVARWRKELMDGVFVPEKDMVAIHGRLSSSLSRKVEFDAIAIHPTRDVAVLRVTQPHLQFFRDAHPFELVFSPRVLFSAPQAGVPRFAYIDQRLLSLMEERAAATGSTDEAQNYLAVIQDRRYEPTWRQGRVAADSAHRFRVGIEVVEGDSGGPVILSNGAVLGVVHQQFLKEEAAVESLPGLMQDRLFIGKAMELRRGDVMDLVERIARGTAVIGRTHSLPAMPNIFRTLILRL